MGIGASLFLIAIGAILKYALPGSVSGVHLGVIGVILMLVGALGLVVTLLIWGPWSRPPVDRDVEVVERRRGYGPPA
jgi:hypothetical protein